MKYDKEALKQIQSTLLKIHNKQRCFFNVVMFEKMGLVYSKKKWSKSPTSGNKIVIGHNFYLTEKGKKILNCVI